MIRGSLNVSYHTRDRYRESPAQTSKYELFESILLVFKIVLNSILNIMLESYLVNEIYSFLKSL